MFSRTLSHLRKQILKIYKELCRKMFMKLYNVICCSRSGNIIKNFHPLLHFHLKPKVLFGCHLQYCVFQKSFWQPILKRFCFNKEARCVHSAFVGRVPLTHCIVIKKIVSLFKPHPPLVEFRTSQWMPPIAVILKPETLWGVSIISRRWQRILKSKLILFSKGSMHAIYHLWDSGG